MHTQTRSPGVGSTTTLFPWYTPMGCTDSGGGAAFPHQDIASAISTTNVLRAASFGFQIPLDGTLVALTLTLTTRGAQYHPQASSSSILPTENVLTVQPSLDGTSAFGEPLVIPLVSTSNEVLGPFALETPSPAQLNSALFCLWCGVDGSGLKPGVDQLVLEASYLPAAPNAPQLSGYADDTWCELVWTRSEAATTYQLYRDGGKIYEGAELTFTDTGLTNNVGYTYFVVAVNEGGSSAASNTVILTPMTGSTSLEPPELAVSTSIDSLVVTWLKVAGALATDLYDEAGALLTRTSEFHYSEHPMVGVQRCFKAKSVNIKTESEFSNTVCARVSQYRRGPTRWAESRSFSDLINGGVDRLMGLFVPGRLVNRTGSGIEPKGIFNKNGNRKSR